MKRSRFGILLFAIFTMPFLQAQDKTEDKDKWTPEDIINTEYMSDVSFSHDGAKIIWTKRRAAEEKDKFVNDIYLTRLGEDPVTTRMTSRDENDYNPVFSKDDQTVFFLSSRDEGKKLWKISLMGGEAEEVHEFENGISSLRFLNDSTFLFISSEGKTLREQKLKEEKDNVIVVEDTATWKPKRVYSFNLKSKSISRLTENDKPVSDYQVSDNGQWMIYEVQQGISFAADARKDPIYFLKNLRTGEVTQILKNLEFPSYSFEFDHENEGFYFISSFANDPEWNGAGINELYYFSLEGMELQKVPLDWEYGLSRGGFELAGENLLVSLANRATNKTMLLSRKGSSWNLDELDTPHSDEHIGVMAVSEDGGKVAYMYSTASTLPEYYLAEMKGSRFRNERTLTELNESLKKKPRTKSEVITWKGYRDEEVTGILYYPLDYEEGKRYPLVLSIHGGPSSQDTDSWSERWSTYPNILAQKGAFVLKPNYHGSANHGLAYVEAIKGNYYEPELEDITKGIQHLSEQGMIDTDKLGTMGWSNGAILTTMLTVRYPDMFRVAAAGAGDVNWTSDYGTCSFGVSFDQSYFGGAPWDDTEGKTYNENYIIKSPLFEMEKVKTPTIIFHGSEDRAVPRDQGWEYYRALQQIGQAPVRFLWFPGQPHGLQKITHQKRKMKEELRWIETYLFEEEKEENEAFKEDSPLAQAIKVSEFKSDGGRYGLLFEGTLIPETQAVKKDSIAIGVFELTHAQYQAFDSDHSFPAGLDNYPVELSREQAGDYLNWLSELTGKTWRMPSAGEAEDLHKKAMKAAAKKANTLNYWAGYDITYDEIEALKAKVKKHNVELLKKVGKYKAGKIGDATVYDLGGNLAEFYSDGIYDLSAYDYFDSAEQKMKDSEHVGLRVIEEL
ncbi:alpha/beta hydrolase family protein [Robertkochia aurantiaca]|uniref:alpha/beta hydrolase family protein n=1 Tax=Robertkochia aurantiaca TaxID=2873700 RepID=UPI001CCE8802|nr:S9 family peptidase [Robertkochia sp. 3YJGBD-33]